jgi:hypothetical protein
MDAAISKALVLPLQAVAGSFASTLYSKLFLVTHSCRRERAMPGEGLTLAAPQTPVESVNAKARWTGKLLNPSQLRSCLTYEWAKTVFAFPLGDVIPAVDDPKLVAEAEVFVGDSNVDGDLPFIAHLGGIQL